MVAAFGSVQPPPPAHTAGWSPPPAAPQPPRGSPQPLKRQRPEDDNEQQQWQQQQPWCQQQQWCQQPPARRRRLDGGPASPAAPFGVSPLPTPQPLAPPQVQQPQQQQNWQQQQQWQQQQWQQQQHTYQQRQDSPELELEQASSMEPASSLEEEDDGGTQEPAARRARAGGPAYRLVLPDSLPPPIPAALLGQPAQPWGAGVPPGLQLPGSDACALVPWSPPLVAAEDLQRQQREQEARKEQLKQQHALRRLQRYEPRYDHEQPLPDLSAVGMAAGRMLGSSAGIRIEELPQKEDDAMEE